ncbi:protein TIFY 6B-like [Salvia divinorum]|uniref:Protein TIFY 6B-like n=1 Tax=Salvia divinorum TaxID=28513 RepID=A0ABD1I2W7_SALDI
MLLAGNGPPMASSSPAPAAPAQASAPRPSILESYVVNHPYGVTSHLLSPAANAPISVSQSHSWAGAISDMNASKQGSVLASSNIVEPLRAVSSPASSSAAFSNSSSSVPQFRRKTSARFLEKRKKRVISTAPHGDKESP